MSARLHVRTRRRFRPDNGFFGRLLDPIDRLTETIYSILILLTFTLAYRIFALDEVRQASSNDYMNELLLAALGATVAWGIIDGIMYILTEALERGERHRILWQIQTAADDETAVDVIADEFDYILEPITGDAQRAALYQDILEHLHDGRPRDVGLKRADFTGALACALIAFIAVLPSLAPFVLFYNHPELAIRVSNVISFVVLFYSGFRWGQYTGSNPWKTGLTLVGVGVVLVAIAIPVGG